MKNWITQNQLPFKSRFTCLLFIIVVISGRGYSQTNNQYIPFNFEYYQSYDHVTYNDSLKLHTALKPYFLESYNPYNSTYGKKDTLQRGLVLRKLLQEHLIEVNKADYTFYADFLPDNFIGYEKDGESVWLSSRGYQVGGTIGKKFSFYSSGYENQGSFPGYVYNFIQENEIIPSQVNDKFGGRRVKDWAYTTALLSYTPVKYINFTLGHDKNFVGDGYRSMLLSDVASNYPFLKLTSKLGNVQYTAMWAQFQDLQSEPLSYENGFRKKWGAFHYVDWNVSKRLSLGIFESIIWQDADETGKRGFDFSYLNPFIFLRPIEGQNGSPDNALLGLNVKYKLFNKSALYGQFLADEFTAKEVFAGNGYWANKFAYQFGIRGADLMKVKNLNFLLEYNTARPFTYTQRTPLINYGHYNQPLAHIYGANFREFVGILNYRYSRLMFNAKLNIANYGLDIDADDNNGKDIFKSYRTRNLDYGNKTSQGIKTNLGIVDARASYIINPTYNLRLELGFTSRIEKNDVFNNSTNILTFGIRSSFRNLYYDF